MKRFVNSSSALAVTTALLGTFTATSAFALTGNVTSATPLGGIGSQCRVRVDFQAVGTDSDTVSGGQSVDNYRIKFIAPGTTTGLGTAVTGGVSQNFTAINLNRTIDLRASNLSGTSLAGAGPSGRLQVVLEDTTGNQGSPNAGPFEDTFSISPQDLRAGSPACQQVANTIDPNRVPTANSGPDQSPDLAAFTAASNTITLDGSGSSDPDGDPLTYQWTQTSGPSVTLSSGTAAQPTFTITPTAQAQTLVFSLNVRDGQAPSAADTVSITIPAAQAVNSAPTANAGTDQTPTAVDYAAAFNTVILDGSGSSDPDGDPLTYQWTQIVGTQVTLSSATAAQPTFQLAPGAQAQTLVFSLSVNDGQVSSAADTVTITIPAAQSSNTAPVANAGPDQNLTIAGLAADNDTVTLDGTASFDGESDPLIYQWTQISGPSVTLSSATSAQPTFALTPAPQPQTLVFSLVTNDGQTDSSADTVSITLPAATLQTSATTPANLAITSNGQQCDFTASFDYTAGSDDGSGEDNFEVRMSDMSGASRYDSGQSGAVAVNTTASVRRTARLRPGTFPQGADPVYFSVFDATPSGGRVLLSQLAVPVSSIQAVPGACANLAPAANTAPVAEAGPNQRTIGTTIVTLDGTGSTDADGDTLSYRWRQTAGTSVILSSTTDPNPTFTLSPTQPSTLVFELIVNDGTVDSVADTVSVSVEPNFIVLNQAPIANAGPDQSGTAGVAVTLDGTASSDPDGDVLSYSWAQVAGPTVTLNDANTATPSFTSNTLTTVNYEFELTVSDGPFDRTDRVQVTVDPAPSATLTASLGAIGGTNRASTCEVRSTITATGGTDDGNGNDNYVIFLTNRAGTTEAGRNLGVAPVGQSVTRGTLSGIRSSEASQFAGDGELFLTVFDADANNDSTGVIVTQRAIDLPDLATRSSNCADIANIVLGTTPNSRPNAVPGPAQTFDRATGIQTVALDGSASNDVDGDTLTYSWSQVAGPTVTLSDATAAQPTFTVDADALTATETYRFELVVNDGTIDSFPTFQTIMVSPNGVPVADAGPDQSLSDITAQTVIALDGTASTDPDGDTLSYAWTQTAGPSVTLSDGAAAQPTFSYDPGTDTSDQSFTFELVVSDGTETSVADSVTIDASVNVAPVATVASVPAQTDYTPGTAIQLDGTSSTDAEGGTLTYSWTQVSGPAVTLTDADTATPSFTYDPTAAPNGPQDFVFALVVSDGAQSSPAQNVTVTLTVDNTAPTASAGADQGPVNAGDTVTLDGSGSSDGEGNALTYRWTQVSGPDVTLSDATAISPTFTAPDVAAEADLVFELVVNDGQFDSSADRVTIAVQPVGSVTIIQTVAGADGAFDYTSDLAALNASLNTSGGTGQLVATSVAAGTYAVSLNDARDRGYALTSLVCDDDNGTTDLSARRATIVLEPGEDVVCTFATANTRDAAQAAIREAVALRSRMILAAEPDRGRRLDRVKGQVAASNTTQVAGFQLPGSSLLPVSATITDQGLSASSSLAQAGAAGLAKGRVGRRTGAGSFDLWGEVQLSNFDFGQKHGNFNVYYVGADYIARDGLLLGVMGQFDSFDLDATDDIGAADGDGFLVGPYATIRLSERFYFDGRAAWGSSDNTVDALGFGREDFETRRGLYTGALIGDFDLGPRTQLQPEIAVRYLDEDVKAYTDRFGVLVDGQSVGLGEVSFAPRLSHSYVTAKQWVVSPFVQAEGIYSFGNAADDVFGTQARLRLEGGATASLPGGARFGLSAFADGIGDSQFGSQGARISLSYTMK